MAAISTFVVGIRTQIKESVPFCKGIARKKGKVVADPNAKRKENVEGDFFVDETCISCGACWALAPVFFESHPVHTYAFVARQPSNSTDVALVREALVQCPVDAIGECKSDREL